MPSPIGHSLIGCATGILLLVPRSVPRDLARALWTARWALLACAAVANAPDLDFIPGLLAGDLNAFHHGPSHSLVWAGLLAVALGALAREVRPGIGRFVAGAVFLLVAGHLVADWLCQDYAEPYGIMPFWPVSTSHHIAPVSVFHAMEKATLGEVFTEANLGPARREFWIGVTCMAAAVALKWRRVPQP